MSVKLKRLPKEALNVFGLRVQFWDREGVLRTGEIVGRKREGGILKVMTKWYEMREDGTTPSRGEIVPPGSVFEWELPRE